MTTINNLEEQKDIYGNSNDQVASVFGFIRELAKIKNKKIFHVKDVDKKSGLTKLKKINCQAFALEMVIKNG